MYVKMDANSFKTTLKNIEEHLKGSEVVLTVVTKGQVSRENHTSLKSFGARVLELEALGAGFNISGVANSFVAKPIHRGKKTDLAYRLSHGVWNKFFITASTLKA